MCKTGWPIFLHQLDSITPPKVALPPLAPLNTPLLVLSTTHIPSFTRICHCDLLLEVFFSFLIRNLHLSIQRDNENLCGPWKSFQQCWQPLSSPSKRNPVLQHRRTQIFHFLRFFFPFCHGLFVFQLVIFIFIHSFIQFIWH